MSRKLLYNSAVGILKVIVRTNVESTANSADRETDRFRVIIERRDSWTVYESVSWSSVSRLCEHIDALHLDIWLYR